MSANFDDIAPAPKSNAVSFDDIVPAAAPVKDEGGKLVKDLTKVKSDNPSVIDAAAALLEQPGALAWQMGSSVVSALGAGAKAAVSRVPGVGEYLYSKTGEEEQRKRYDELSGMSYGEAFTTEYNRLSENAASMYRPLTKSGERLTKAINTVFDTAIKYVGDSAFEYGIPMVPGPVGLILRTGKGTPEAGAAGETLAAAAAMLVGGKGGKKAAEVDIKLPKGTPAVETPPAPVPFREAWSSFKEKYPKTADSFEAMNVGKIRMSDFRAEDTNVFDAVGRKLDKELGLPSEMKDMTLEGKIRLAMQKASAGEHIPAGEIDKATRATLDGLRYIDGLRQSAANERGLPRPNVISNEPVIVTKNGVTMTADQAASMDSVFLSMSPEERANALGVSAMGRMRLKLEEANKAREDGNNAAATKAEKELSKMWEQNFPFRDKKARTETLDVFKNFGGRVTYEEMVNRMGPAKRQLGMIEVEGFEYPKDQGKKVVQAAAGSAAARSWNVPNKDQERVMSEKVQAAYDVNRLAEEESVKKSFGEGLARMRRNVLGHDIDLKNALEKSGPYGEKARLNMVLQRGATDAAKAEMHQINARLFNDLTPEMKKAVDELMRDRRIVEIQSYNPKYKIPEGITGQEAEAHARNMARTLGQEAYDKVSARTDAIMAEYRKLLADSLASGLLSRESFDKLIHFEYSPTQYIDLLDPIQQFSIRGQKITVRGSGIPELQSGRKGAVRMDSQGMLAEAIARVRNREFKNRTLQSLWDLADTNPDNGIVKIRSGGKPGVLPEQDWTALSLRIGGEQKQIFMRDEFAQQFVSNPQPMIPWVASMIRLLSGSSIMRFSAVGGNPFFAAAGIPMDILHTWSAAGREYSPHMPVYFGQIGKDMIKVLPDLINKTGKYQQAMKEGLGAQYMTSYGQQIIMRDKTLAEKMMPKHERIMKVLQGFNQDADIWVRMAHRERLIDRGMPSEMATAMARDRLDYAQGGELIKGIDNAIAFTNVATQALYKTAKAAKRNPTDFATKVAWMTGAVASSVLANMIASSETWKQIPTNDKIRGLNITFGDQLFLIDPDGNKRYFYVPLRLDQVASPIIAAVVGGLEMAEYGKLPSNLIKETINQSTNLLGTADFIPTMSAITAMTGWDSFRSRPIYQGPKVLPEDEVRHDTAPLAKMLGQATGLSPMRMETAFGKFVSPNNMWVQIAGGSIRLLMGDSDPRDKAMTSEHFLVQHLRPIVKLTNPLTQYLDGTEDKVMAVNSVKKRQHDALDALVYGAEHGQNSMKDVQAWITTQPAQDREALYNRAKNGYQIDQIMQRYEAGSIAGIPPRSWWKITAAAPPEARAQEFHSKWLDADPDARRSMEQIAGRVKGYTSDAFKREIMRERSRLGDERR